jgi:hypothetical protein
MAAIAPRLQTDSQRLQRKICRLFAGYIPYPLCRQADSARLLPDGTQKRGVLRIYNVRIVAAQPTP